MERKLNIFFKKDKRKMLSFLSIFDMFNLLNFVLSFPLHIQVFYRIEHHAFKNISDQIYWSEETCTENQTRLYFLMVLSRSNWNIVSLCSLARAGYSYT